MLVTKCDICEKLPTEWKILEIHRTEIHICIPCCYKIFGNIYYIRRGDYLEAILELFKRLAQVAE